MGEGYVGGCGHVPDLHCQGNLEEPREIDDDTEKNHREEELKETSGRIGSFVELPHFVLVWMANCCVPEQM